MPGSDTSFVSKVPLPRKKPLPSSVSTQPREAVPFVTTQTSSQTTPLMDAEPGAGGPAASAPSSTTICTQNASSAWPLMPKTLPSASANCQLLR